MTNTMYRVTVMTRTEASGVFYRSCRTRRFPRLHGFPGASAHRQRAYVTGFRSRFEGWSETFIHRQDHLNLVTPVWLDVTRLSLSDITDWPRIKRRWP